MIRRNIAERRAQRFAANAAAITTRPSSITVWIRNASAAIIDDSVVAWEITKDTVVRLGQNIADVTGSAWNKIAGFSSAAYRSIAARFDLRGELAQIRKSMEQPFARHATTVNNRSGMLVLASLQITLLDVSGNPYAHAPVVLFSSPQSGTTDERGIVVFHDVELREHRLEIHTPDGTVKQRKINLSSATPASAVGTKDVAITIPEIRIVVDDGQGTFGRATPYLFVLWSLGIMAIGSAGGVWWMKRKKRWD